MLNDDNIIFSIKPVYSINFNQENSLDKTLDLVQSGTMKNMYLTNIVLKLTTLIIFYYI